jgi:hypothetical protein
MGFITLGGTHRYDLLVDIKFVTVVSGHMDYVFRGNGSEIEVLPEIIDTVIVG